MTEKPVFHINGYLGLILVLVILGLGAYLSVVGWGVLGAILVVLAVLAASSLTIIGPNQSKVLTFFGRYIGTIKESGLYLTVPLTTKATVSLRVRNFNSAILKVNDLQGNPVEIAAVIVFKVVDTSKALFAVEDYEKFVEIQSESAIRHVASEYAYDNFGDHQALTLRSNPTEVSNHLTEELQARLEVAGVQIIETRLTHLAYATEIASAMLQRQQSQAILSARKIIVEGAVSITEGAIEQLAAETDLHLTDNQKLQLINNMMVSIINERGSQPVINTGKVE
ncbi:SPFH domain-containing protein [Levilactobacillus brevis]|uniref:SPFH domain-containing protein n=1 Tax=Levilactobacillus brevis TaxID=1580 RepID=A0AA41JTV9_LEVBR|nr:SPFH domain-containing protein [Levilactobacillus brevis]KID44554.1 Membrane protease family protein [Levilactobacillus brevis]MBS0947721.1 SPFH domain-containing protein [Levilactobacillus brevis]MBS0977040.1 SPFH domain-containing protein [Levilactobacillus brevis]MBS1010866.1 SPFH domain-containing protein [Levilactobacillus brevis]MCU0199371.1 SPFH domain-containing protein [Levilactobacillus brevis]